MSVINIDTIRKRVDTALRQMGNFDHQKGDLATAERRCQSILATDPGNADALHLLSILHSQTGRKKTAINLILQAIRICPNNPIFFNNLGSLLKSDSKFDKAKHCYQKALILNPNYPEALYNLAGIFHIQEQFEKALKCYQKAVALNKKFPEAFNNMAATLNMICRYDEAIDCCKEALKIRPNYSESFNNMGNAYQGLGRPALAVACYEKSMALSGESAEVLCNLANAFQEEGKINLAIETYKKAIRLNPSYGKAYNNLGTAYRSKWNLKEAEHLFKQSIKLAPENAQGYHNLGNIFYDKGDYRTAASWYDKAISIHPGSVETYINRGIIYQENGESTNALKCFNKALAIAPHNSKAYSHMVHELYQVCDWHRMDELNTRIDKFTERELANGHRPHEMPFLSLIRNADPSINFRIARSWSREISKSILGNNGSLKFRHIRSKQQKVTIGYLSNNFRNHPTSHLISEIFELHDRTRFAINAYSYGENDGSLYREKIRQKCDKFIDLRNLNHEEAAQHIFDDCVDILVDLVGYMRGNRLEICAYQPAPVQVRWLGLAGTTGANFFDYIITDNIVTPEDQTLFYSEKFVYMPDTYQVNSKPLGESCRKFSRYDLGLPVDGFVYCCFCSSYKIEPVIFKNWMDILKRVPNSVLWLLKSDDIVVNNLRSEVSKCGIDQERIVFAEKMDKMAHLDRLKLADVALDTIVVNGAATTSDALWAGIPVITIKGSHFASRMSASILNAVGLNDLVLGDEDSYRKVAVGLGKNRKLVEEVKERLAANRLEKSLFDTHGFVKNLEKAYSKMWEGYRNGMKPKLIHVKDT
ncbi:tetratricopeptide repeat protein [Desulfosarcina sp.]|uniref:tetratricopeptide repeat protein n=1 Tax=Desulfosarcina sp. TaxID=2027861 RepID=UPI003970BA4B